MEHKTVNRERADELLVVRCQLGEHAAFDDLIRRWSGPLRRYALKLTNDPDAADDLTQEVWMRAIQGLGRLRQSAHFRPWLFGIAHRTLMDRLRIRYAIPIDESASPEDVAAVDAGEEEDLHEVLETGMAALPVIEREVLTLFYFAELSLADIAGALGVPVGTVKSRLFRARTLLRKQILQEDPS